MVDIVDATPLAAIRSPNSAGPAPSRGQLLRFLLLPDAGLAPPRASPLAVETAGGEVVVTGPVRSPDPIDNVIVLDDGATTGPVPEPATASAPS